MKVRDLFAAYVRHAGACGLWCQAANVQRVQTFDLFLAAFGDRPVEGLVAYELSDWIESQPGWRSTATRKARCNQVNACFNWAVRQGRCLANPFRGVAYAEAPPRPCLPDADLQKLLDHANPRFAEVLRFLRLTGCRLSELCRVTWPDVDLGRGLVVLVNHKARKKTGRVRSFVLVAQAVLLLENVRRRQGAEYRGHCFQNTQGRPWTRETLVWSFRRLADRLKLTTEASLHGIRHQFASVAVENGAPVKLISEQLGHATSAITERYYVKITNLEAVKGAALLAAVVAG